MAAFACTTHQEALTVLPITAFPSSSAELHDTSKALGWSPDQVVVRQRDAEAAKVEKKEDRGSRRIT